MVTAPMPKPSAVPITSVAMVSASALRWARCISLRRCAASIMARCILERVALGQAPAQFCELHGRCRLAGDIVCKLPCGLDACGDYRHQQHSPDAPRARIALVGVGLKCSDGPVWVGYHGHGSIPRLAALGIRLGADWHYIKLKGANRHNIKLTIAVLFSGASMLASKRWLCGVLMSLEHIEDRVEQVTAEQAKAVSDAALVIIGSRARQGCRESVIPKVAALLAGAYREERASG